MEKSIKRLQKVEYHRNGCSGMGFMVGIADCVVDGKSRKMLMVQFPTDSEESPAIDQNMQTAVLDLDLLAKGDIGGMKGWNQWRGDRFADEFAKKGQASLNRKNKSI